MLESHAEQIAQSAALAAWLGAGSSTFASIVALSVAVWGARREDAGRRRLSREQETAFAFGMVGALEMLRPLVAAARQAPADAISRRRLDDALGHATMIADAALAIQVLDMQLLRDGYLLRGALHALRGLLGAQPGESVPNAELLATLDPVLNSLLDADDRFFARLPAITEVQGIGGRTPLTRQGA